MWTQKRLILPVKVLTHHWIFIPVTIFVEIFLYQSPSASDFKLMLIKVKNLLNSEVMMYGLSIIDLFLIIIFWGHAHWILHIAWSPDGKKLASGCKNGEVRMWFSILLLIRVLRVWQFGVLFLTNLIFLVFKFSSFTLICCLCEYHSKCIQYLKSSKAWTRELETQWGEVMYRGEDIPLSGFYVQGKLVSFRINLCLECYMKLDPWTSKSD